MAVLLMVEGWLEQVTPCEHGSMESHPTMEGIKSGAIDLKAGGSGPLGHWKKGMSYKHDCPGGSRVKVEPDIEAAAKAEYDHIAPTKRTWDTEVDAIKVGFRETARIGVDAALGGTE